MSIQHFGKATLRVAKNYTKGYSDVQAKLREATSNDPWGPSGTQMNEIAQMTYNQNDFVEIMEMLDKRLNDKGKNWRHVFKALTVLDYLLHAGSENVVIYFRDNIYIIKTLKEFQYIDEYSKDQGANVRQKAKDITNLLQDEGRLRQERSSRASMRDRLTQGESGHYDNHDENVGRRAAGKNESNKNESRPAPARSGGGGEDDDLKRAIEESKKSLAEEKSRTAEELDLKRAIQLSEEEEARRNKSVEETNSRSLFDDSQPIQSTNPFPLIDASIQPQYTAVVPNFTSFNPYQQQAEQEALQAAYLQQQQEWLRQQQEAQAQAQAQAQLQAQQDEWNRQQQYLLYQQQQQQQQQQQLLQPQQPLGIQPTGFGSNNPFALQTFGQSPSPIHSPPLISTSTPSTASSISNFSLPSTFASHSPATTPSSTPSVPRVATRADAEHSHLANLFANREDGLDTFGNIGNLRYGHTDAGRLVTQKTGAPSHNPFALNQQQQNNDQPFFTI